MKLDKKTYCAYQGIANYCRTGNLEQLKGLSLREDRMSHYRRLVYNITNNALKQAYPILLKLLTAAQWKAMVDDFFENHKAQAYRIWQMPKEFYTYIVAQDYQQKFEIVFLNDLVLFEWIEIEVHTMPDEKNTDKLKIEGNYWEDIPILMPEYRLLQFEYPVHLKKTKQITKEDKGAYFLLAYRTPEGKVVKFLDLSIFYAYIIEQVEEKKSLENIVANYCTITNTPFTHTLKENAISFITSLQYKQLVLGFL